MTNANAVVIKGMAEKVLRDFVAQLENLTDAEIKIEPQWALWSDSPAVMTALGALFNCVPPKIEKKKNNDPAGEPKAHKQIRTWDVHIVGVTGTTTDPIEKLTIDEKNARLEAGSFQEGTLLRHPASGFSKVIGPQGTEQYIQAIDTEEAVAILDGAA